jgi:hypothetical protein
MNARPPAARGAAAPSRDPVVLAAVALAIAALCCRYRDAYSLPFLNDDYVFLDATRARSFVSLWGFDHLFFHWWRPWSREFHYWWLQRAAGISPPAFHAMNAALTAGVFALFAALIAPWLGRSRTVVAVLGLAALSAWSLPLLWSAGAQDLWMMLACMAALLAWRSERRVLAVVAYAVALASKETAAPLPLLLVLHDVLLTQRSWPQALRRAAPAALVVLPWALAHPHLGGRLLQHVVIEPVPAAAHRTPAALLMRTLFMLVNLDRRLSPLAPWPHALAGIVLPALASAGVIVWASRTRERASTPAPARRVALFGAAWAACGWLALLLPGLGWHAYYGLFGACGAWLAIAALVPPGVPVALAIALITAASAARDATPSADWGDADYQRRAGHLQTGLHAALVRELPRPEPHTRLWFVGLPNDIGFLAGDGPAVRVWYADSTLRAGYFSAWHAWPENAPGRDRFFKLKPGPRLVELHEGDEDAAVARAQDSEWAEDHLSLGHTFAEAGDWARAEREFRKLAAADPRDAEPAYNVGLCRMAQRDTADAVRWLTEAAHRPLVRERLRRAAHEAGLPLWP